MISVCSYDFLIGLVTNLIIKIENWKTIYSYISSAMKLLNRFLEVRITLLNWAALLLKVLSKAQILRKVNAEERTKGVVITAWLRQLLLRKGVTEGRKEWNSAQNTAAQVSVCIYSTLVHKYSRKYYYFYTLSGCFLTATLRCNFTLTSP